MAETDVLVFDGGEVKSLGSGKFQGWAIVYGDPTRPDKSKNADFFTADTDYGLYSADEWKSVTAPVMFLHGQDSKFGKTRIGQVKYTKKPLGIWAEGVLKVRKEYEAKFADDLADIETLIENKALGLSTGVPGHLVERLKMGSASFLKTWPLDRSELSLTPSPAEPRTLAVSLKSLLKSTDEAASASFVEILNRAASVLSFSRGRNDLTASKREAIKGLRSCLNLYRDSVIDPEKIRACSADVDELLTRFKV